MLYYLNQNKLYNVYINSIILEKVKFGLSVLIRIRPVFFKDPYPNFVQAYI